MKHIWDVEELATHWRLSFEEMQLLKSKPARNHLPLVAQLKYYQYTGRFPGAASDIPPTVLHYLADQVGADVNQTNAYGWSGRTGTRHRREILQFLGVRRVPGKDVARNWIHHWIVMMAKRSFQRSKPIRDEWGWKVCSRKPPNWRLSIPLNYPRILR